MANTKEAFTFNRFFEEIETALGLEKPKDRKACSEALFDWIFFDPTLEKYHIVHPTTTRATLLNGGDKDILKRNRRFIDSLSDALVGKSQKLNEKLIFDLLMDFSVILISYIEGEDPEKCLEDRKKKYFENKSGPASEEQRKSLGKQKLRELKEKYFRHESEYSLETAIQHIVELLSPDYITLRYKIKTYLDSNKGPTALLYLLILSLYPESRSKENLIKLPLYQAILGFDDYYILFHNTIEDDCNTSDDLKAKLARHYDGSPDAYNRLSEIDQNINEWTKGDLFAPIPNSFTLSTLSQTEIFIQYGMIKAYECYTEDKDEEYKKALGYCSLIRQMNLNIQENNCFYDYLKVLYLRALSLWKLKIHEEKDAQLEEILRLIIRITNPSHGFSDLACLVYKQLGVSANRIYRFNDVITYNTAAIALLNSDNRYGLSGMKHNLAIACRKVYRLEDAKTFYEQACFLRNLALSFDGNDRDDLQDNIRNQELMDVIRVNRATAFTLLGEYEKAEEDLIGALARRANRYRESTKDGNEPPELVRSRYALVLQTYARLYLMQAENALYREENYKSDAITDSANSERTEELLSNAKEYIDRLGKIKYPEKNEKSKKSQEDERVNTFTTIGKEQYLRAVCLKDRAAMISGFEALDRAKKLLAPKEDILYRTANGMCHIMQSKLCLLRLRLGGVSDSHTMIREAKQGLDVIETIRNEMTAPKYYGYNYATALFHLGASIEICADMGDSGDDTAWEELHQYFSETDNENHPRYHAEKYLNFTEIDIAYYARYRAAKYLEQALKVIQECGAPINALSDKKNQGGMFLEKVENIISAFRQLCGNRNESDHKKDLFLAYPIDFYLL